MPSLTRRDLNVRNVTHHPRQPSVLRGELVERRLSTSRLSTDSSCRQQEPQNQPDGLEVSNALISSILIMFSGYTRTFQGVGKRGRDMIFDFR